MMKNFILVVFASALGAAAPQKRLESTCERGASLATPDYHVVNWVDQLAGEGSQCVTLDGFSGRDVSWHADFSWPESRWVQSGPASVNREIEKRDIADYTSMPATMNWSYGGKDITASIGFSIAGSGPGCPSMQSWIVNIWLGTYGDELWPDRQEGVLYTTTTIGGVGYDVWKDRNPLGPAIVAYTFVAWYNQTRFSGDLVDFVSWPGKNDGNGQVRCVHTVLGGTEVYGATNATFKAEGYSVQQNFINGPSIHT